MIRPTKEALRSIRSWIQSVDPSFDKEVIVFDIETRTDFKTFRLAGFSSSAGAGYRFVYDQGTADALLRQHIMNGDYILTWNGSRFDIPFFNISPVAKINHIDGMLLAKMVAWNEGKFGLDYWSSKYYGITKPEIDYDNSEDSDLEQYLKHDLMVTANVISTLLWEGEGLGLNKSSVLKACDLEQRVARSVQSQVNKRVRFDLSLAVQTYNQLLGITDTLKKKIDRELPEVLTPANKLHYPPKKQFKLDGTPTQAIINYADKYGYEVREGHGDWWLYGNAYIHRLPITRPLNQHTKLTADNQAMIKEWLLNAGWVPTEWNYNSNKEKTTPRLTLKGTGEPCPNLEKLDFAASWIIDYREYLQAKARKNVLQSDKGTGWIPKTVDAMMRRRQPALPSDADTMGANTGRYTHKVIANVPRPGSYFGEEFRQLFCARDGMKWVGWDASALEARVEAHYCHPIDPDYAKELCEGDVHSRNLALIPDLGNRMNAKTFKYAVTYGATPKKLAASFGWELGKAEEIYAEFWNNNPALRELNTRLIRHWEGLGKKFIVGLDRRPIWTRSQHSLLNALFQSAGAIIMKHSHIVAEHTIRTEFSAEEAYGLIRYHDEEVWECLPQHADRVAEIGVGSIIAAGKYLNLNVPLAGEAKIGNNWLEVH